MLTIPGMLFDAKALTADGLGNLPVNTSVLVCVEDESVAVSGITLRDVDVYLDDPYFASSIHTMNGRVSLDRDSLVIEEDGMQALCTIVYYANLTSFTSVPSPLP